MASVLALAIVLFHPAVSPPHTRRNVLYIVIDDLRAEMEPYGQPATLTPALSSLARESTVFTRAYCNQPVCSPSRNSFMTGRRPSTTRVWNFLESFRTTVGQSWTTLPSHFLNHNYTTLGTGKLFHPGRPTNGDGTASWSSIPAVQFNCNHSDAGKPGTYCLPTPQGCDVQGDDFAPHPRWCAIATTKGPDFNVSFADVETLDDARMKLRYASSVRKASGGKTPFFVGVGLAKPHLDFRIPKLFLDRYPVTNTTALHPVAQAGRPPVSIHCPFQADSYAKKWHAWGFVDPWTPMRSESAAQMRRYYKAATSFMDWIVGELLDELKSGGDEEDTLVVFHSDHGWSLGENGDWKKFTLTELGVRVPLIIRAPWLKAVPRRSNALIELIDVMPSIFKLIGLPPADVAKGDAPLDGVSFAPLLEGSSRDDYTPKPFVWAQYPRCPTHANVTSLLWLTNLCIETPASKFGWMGYSLRSADGWRYNAWFAWNGTSLAPIVPPNQANGSAPRNGTTTRVGGRALLFFSELYQYDESGETESDLDALDRYEVAAMNQDVVDAMHAKLLAVIV